MGGGIQPSRKAECANLGRPGYEPPERMHPAEDAGRHGGGIVLVHHDLQGQLDVTMGVT